MASFHLSKWYADVVDPTTGYLAICYDSHLRWGKLAVHFTNLLCFRPPDFRQTAASFVQESRAELNSDETTFTLRQGRLHGSWQQRAPALRELLLETAHGSVLWECFFPAATARLVIDGIAHIGLGYVERLTLTIVPWQLPLQALRWGRFLAPDQYVVWIRWEGAEPRHLVFYNGQRYADTGSIGDDGLVFGEHELAFTEKYSLRAGAVGSTVFKRFPWFRKLFPARILYLDEAKWWSRGTLTKGGKAVATGQVVHERVEWPS
ncbi:MAG TPA: hypothetical protein VF629_04440 [Hymenobacter sp.]|jgi:hypothetical protein|uniref:hypothetical protein n=1 Tax=Hymenobacter sp. TaxID=1898978 RepID=UPI002ED9DCE0